MEVEEEAVMVGEEVMVGEIEMGEEMEVGEEVLLEVAVEARVEIL